MSVRIIHGDADDALRRLPAGSVKLLITDPPYRTLTRGAQVYAAGLGFRTLSWRSIATHLTIARRRLRPDGVAMLVVNRASASDARAAMRAAGFRRLATVTWLNGQLGGDASTFVRGRRPPPRRDVVVVGLMPSARSALSASCAPCRSRRRPSAATRPRSRSTSALPWPASPASGPASA